MNRTNWTMVAVFGIVVLLVFLVGVSLLGGRGYGGWGMMGPGMMGGWGFGPFGWIGMIFMWLIPVGSIVLSLAGVIWLVRAIGGGAANPLLQPVAPPAGAALSPTGATAPIAVPH